MGQAELHVVTGALGFTGRFLAERLLADGKRVRTLTGHPERPHPFGDRIEIHPYNWDRPDQLARSLEGAAVLYNTYWIRFPRGQTTFETAVENSRRLFCAAAEAGVGRVVHVSIANCSVGSPLPYYRGKALVEGALEESGLPYGILRPAVLFGRQDVLINNIAWMLRHMPVFGVMGRGEYKIQPIHVDDMVDLMVEAGRESTSTVKDAVGPELYTFEELVRTIRAAVGSRCLLVHVPPAVGYLAARAVSVLVRDLMLTRDEVRGLLAGLLYSKEPPTGSTRLSDWLQANASSLGRRYASELDRHYRPVTSKH